MYYSIRLLYLVFVDSFGGFRRVIGNHAKVTNLEIFLLVLLGMLSIATGHLFKDTFTGFGSAYFGNLIHGIANGWSALELEFIPARIKLVPLITGAVALLLALYLSNQSNASLVYTYQMGTYLESCKWFYNEILNAGLVVPTLNLGRTVFEQYEKSLLERHGPMFLVTTIKRLN